MAVRIGVIGVGAHGLHHVRVLSKMTAVEFVGVYDASPDASHRAVSECGVMAFPSLSELLDHVDCVSVAVPTSHHYEVVMSCLKRGVSTLVEKPISDSVHNADLMIGEAEKRRLILAVGHLERFNSAYRSVKSESFNPVFIESHRLAVFNPRGTDVSVVFDLMIHDIDIVLDMVKKPVNSIHASGVSVVSDEIDIANARLEFEGGCVANLTASRISQKKMRKVRTFRRNAYISMDFLTGESEVFTLNPDIRPDPNAGVLPQMMEGISYTKTPNDGQNALQLELDDFIQSVKNGTKPKITGNDGREALDVASKILNKINDSFRSVP